jgi:hypothetical protein
MNYFTTTFSHLKVRAIRYKLEAQLKQSIKTRALSKGLEVKKAKVINVTYNADWSFR